MESKSTNEPYPELQDLCAYHQWTIDDAHFQATTKDYFEKLTVDREAEIERLRSEFIKTNAIYIEKTLWDWCPIWRVLHANGKFLDELPTMPWTHSSEFLHLSIIGSCL